MMKKYIVLLLFLAIAPKSTAQQEDLEKVTAALSKGDVAIVTDYASESKYGPVSFLLPNKSEERILKDEFAKKVKAFFTEYPPKSFNLIQSGKDPITMLPFVSGKLESQNNRVVYILMTFAKFGDAYRFVMFHIYDKLPEG